MAADHDVQIIEAKQVNDECVAYRIVCCGLACSPERCNPGEHTCHESVHTANLSSTDFQDAKGQHDPALLDAWIESRKQKVAAKHEAMVQWRERKK